MTALGRFVILFAALLPFMAAAQEPAPAIEILSKDDAREMFAMTKQEWVVNVQRAVAAGVATSTGTPETNFGMAMTTMGTDLLLVTPSYGEDGRKPEFIQVVVGYRDPTAQHLSDAALKEAIETAREQLAPEYDVIGDSERLEGGASVWFIITER